MEFEGGGENKMLGLRLTPKHKRSMSFPDKKQVEKEDPDYPLESTERTKLDMGYLTECDKAQTTHTPTREVQNTLKQEILKLERRLQDQFEVRCTLEKALGYRPKTLTNSTDVRMPKPAIELIKEIAVLELEVVYLEQHLLSLYRKAFDQQLPSPTTSTKEETAKSPPTTPRAMFIEDSKPKFSPKRGLSAVQSNTHELESPLKQCNGSGLEGNLIDSSVHRCASSLSQHKRMSPPESLAKALRACHSQPLSMMEYAQNTSSNIISLAEHLGTCISDHVPESANRISEDMVKCISTIYCKLADPPLTYPGISPPSSSLSSTSAFSPGDHGDMWSPGFRNNSSFDVHLDNPFHVEGLKEFSGPYSTMFEVSCILTDSQKLGDTEQLLQNFRSLICRLEEVDPGKLKHEEKLAFWINIHNALVMHAFLAYGIPQNNVKRAFLLLKAAYNVGGHTVSADTIQSSILGCRVSRPGQWLRLFLSPKTNFKTGDKRQSYAVMHREPLLHFALCSGNHSDPAVRVYTPMRVFQELEVAKEEYIRATFGVSKDEKILLPKLVESFAKDSGLCPVGVMEMIQQNFPESLGKSIKKSHLANAKSRKNIEFIPHKYAFRYLISKELVN
ncbi:hypothetical protein L6164_027761 [Bauhinia variegata]|uniref:Uncharacterized protein n=1 Tax=Bauhinia variegata TaxID=167791 RepID=A0ACB9LUW6_BAUVA|nr:hypothetical protein L6164_027761 [Bauhinia variegata]